MSDVVVILGAGASRSTGAPLMYDFLDRAEDLWLAKRCGDHGADFARLFEMLSALKATQAQILLDTFNMEAVFSALEMGALC